MHQTKYSAVPIDAEDLGPATIGPSPSKRLFTWLIASLLAMSLCVNSILFYTRYHEPWRLGNALPTRYASLSRDIPVPLSKSPSHLSTNLTIQNTAWIDPTLVKGAGVLALTHSHAASLALPRSQSWPWSDEKDVYVLSSTHSLHCINLLRLALNDNYFDDKSVKDNAWGYPHLLHCLDLLRQNVECEADDRPLALEQSTEDGRVVSRPRLGQVAMCRDWDAVAEWGRKHSACYKPGLWDDGKTERERYMSCPDGSEPWKHMDS